jgi:hypothetical protein
MGHNMTNIQPLLDSLNQTREQIKKDIDKGLDDIDKGLDDIIEHLKKIEVSKKPNVIKEIDSVAFEALLARHALLARAEKIEKDIIDHKAWHHAKSRAEKLLFT